MQSSKNIPLHRPEVNYHILSGLGFNMAMPYQILSTNVIKILSQFPAAEKQQRGYNFPSKTPLGSSLIVHCFQWTLSSAPFIYLCCCQTSYVLGVLCLACYIKQTFCYTKKKITFCVAYHFILPCIMSMNLTILKVSWG